MAGTLVATTEELHATTWPDTRSSHIQLLAESMGVIEPMSAKFTLITQLYRRRVIPHTLRVLCF
jgi:hypothetical protein